MPTAANVWAYRLFRDKDSTHWCLNRSIFLALDAAWGPCPVDRFVTAQNAQLPRFTLLLNHPGAEAVDGLQQDWGGPETNYMKPLFAQARLVIKKIVRERATAVVVLPAWPAQNWWAETLHRANAAVYLPSAAALYTHGSYAALARPPFFWTVALLLVAGGRQLRRWPGALTPTPRLWRALRALTAPRRWR